MEYKQTFPSHCSWIIYEILWGGWRQSWCSLPLKIPGVEDALQKRDTQSLLGYGGVCLWTKGEILHWCEEINSLTWRSLATLTVARCYYGISSYDFIRLCYTGSLTASKWEKRHFKTCVINILNKYANLLT